MGAIGRPQPERLAEKLAEIRTRLDLSQLAMAKALSTDGVEIDKGAVSRFERGEREPYLILLLKYARLAKCSVDVLIDDKLNLPK